MARRIHLLDFAIVGGSPKAPKKAVSLRFERVGAFADNFASWRAGRR
jgi:hypothetical protein